MEDLFKVDAHGKAPGIDGLGHLGYAAQPGLRPFGTDVFTNTKAYVKKGVASGAAAEAGVSVVGVVLTGGVLLAARRRRPHGGL